ncbi:MAG: hypothetical protein AABX07_03235 [Nanoarchaeota archaeon]
MSGLIQDIKPKGVSSAYVNAPFDEGKGVLENAGYKIITGEENAGLRVDYGKDAKVSTCGNYVREGNLMVPKKGRFITRGSLVLAHPKEATQAHREGKEFYITPEQAEILLTDAVEISYDAAAVPTNRFGEDPVAIFLFGKNAARYGSFLRDVVKIDNMPLSFYGQEYINSKEQPFINQVWLAGLDDVSAVDGNWSLNYYNAVRGVFFDAEGVAQQKPLQRVYASDQISDAFRIAGIQRLESMVREVLESK